jgi:hypothetical protein
MITNPHFIPKVIPALLGAPSFRGATSGIATSETSITLNLTELTGGSNTAAKVGDLVLVLVGWVSASDNSPNVISSGYTKLVELHSDDTRDSNLGLFVKFIEDMTDPIIVTNTIASATYGSAAIAYVWSNVNNYFMPIETKTGTNSAYPVSPALYFNRDGCVALTLGIGTSDASPLELIAPANYDRVSQRVSAGTGSGCILAAAAKDILVIGSESPGAWSGGKTTASDSWAAITVGLYPAKSIDIFASLVDVAAVNNQMGVSADLVEISMINNSNTTSVDSVELTIVGD